MTRFSRNIARLVRASLLPGVASLALLAACGSNNVKNQAPFVQVTSWQLEGTQLLAALRIRNLNDDPLEVARLGFTATVQDVELASYDGTHQTEVTANGFETLILTLMASTEGAGLLTELEDGAQQSLPYSLKGSLETTGGKKLRFERTGHIYPVPGKPGHFR